jgi:hypothetical protein
MSSLVTWCSSADSLFADSVSIGLPLYTDFRGLFTRLWPPFADFIYVGLPLYIDFCGLFTRL